MEVYLAQPRGFCAGVVRAIEIVERALEKYGPPVYVRHEIVHNKYVVESLKIKGAIFVEDLSEVPPLAVTVFSAHGVARTVEEEAAARGLPVLNATCPLVTSGQVALRTGRPRAAASSSTVRATPCALNTVTARGGTSDRSSTNIAPLFFRLSTTYLLWTIS